MLDWGGHETAGRFNADGTAYGKVSDYDLVNTPTKHEGWVNIYPGGDGMRCVYGVFSSKQAAETADILTNGIYGKLIATVKIEWEE